MHTRIVRHGDSQTFLRRARPWLLHTEAEHTLVLGLADGALTGAAAIYAATVEENGVVVGCALRTTPRKLVVTRMPPSAVPALVVDVAACYDALPAVVGPPTAAREFAQHWAERHGCATREGMQQRIYVLTDVVEPTRSPAGAMRLAEASDTNLVTSWIDCFARELHVDVPRTRADTAARIAAGDIALWWDGQTRALAGVAGRSPNGARVGPVYTPPEWRGRGYASAVVAALSRKLLEDGARFCTLYTDLSNPTSNAIYQNIGYEPLCDAIDMEFVPRT